MSALVRFGVFEVDVQTREVRRQGVKVRVQEQPFQVLLLMLDRPGEVVAREDLRQRLWPANTYVDFDKCLNRAINRLRETLGDSADNPRFIETIPQRGYRFIAPVEITETNQLAPGPAQSPAATSRRLPRWVFPLVAVLLLSAGVILAKWGGWLFPRSGTSGIQSLAVLPLENLSGDPAQEYFADGMTEALITAIAQIGPVRVISRTSVMQYKKPRKPLPAIANELGVDAIVEGTVTHSVQKVRITAQLIRARDDRHLWSADYERDLGEVIKLQGEVAHAIAGQIQMKLTPQARASMQHVRRVNPRAFELYLEGTYFRTRGTAQALNQSVESFARALELDPEYAQAYAGLAHTYYVLGIRGLRPPAEAFPKAEVAAMKALGIDDTVVEAHTSLAEVKKGFDWNWAAAEARYRRAIELSPSYSLAHAGYSDYLSKMGRHDEAVAEAFRASEFDPLSAGSVDNLARILYRARRYDDAMRASQKALSLDANNPAVLWMSGLIHEQKREFLEATGKLERAVGLSPAPIFRAALGHVYATAGERVKALAVLHDLMKQSRQSYVSPLDIAMVHAGLGNQDSAFEWLERAYRERTMRIQELPDPVFDGLRSERRFGELMKRIGLPM